MVKPSEEFINLSFGEVDNEQILFHSQALNEGMTSASVTRYCEKDSNNQLSGQRVDSTFNRNQIYVAFSYSQMHSWDQMPTHMKHHA
ncbi:hypothetical protein NPIL_129421, partial [Nephila pilipes]